MENPINMDDLGVPLFLETPIWKLRFLHVQVPSVFSNPRSIFSQAERVANEVEAKRIEMPTQVEQKSGTIEVESGVITWDPIFSGFVNKQQMFIEGNFEWFKLIVWLALFGLFVFDDPCSCGGIRYRVYNLLNLINLFELENYAAISAMIYIYVFIHIYIYIYITLLCSQFSMSMWISFVSWAHLLRQVPTLLPGWPGRSTRGLGNQSKQLWPAVKKGRKSKINLFLHALIFSYHLSSTGSNAQFHIEIVK